jgi:hypothetical protein
MGADLERPVKIDAVVSASSLTLDLAQELDRLAPFGLGNPDVTLLVPACDAVDPVVLGGGRHLRFRVKQHGRDGGSAIAFGLGEELARVAGGGPFDLAFRLKENHWNGTVAPQLVVRRLLDAPHGYLSLRKRFVELWRAGEDAWTPEARAVFAELRLEQGGGPRELLESPTFRALLDPDQLLEAA